MKRLPKRDGIRRVKVYRGRSDIAMMRSALAHGIQMTFDNIAETEGCEILVRQHGRKPRLAFVPVTGRKV
jgi:hypothetical protein